MTKKCIALVLWTALLLCLCAPALAADTGYSGPLDPETGEPLGQETRETEGRTALSATMY